MFDAIILAGGTSDKQFNAIAKERFEALIDIGGQPMVTFVARALAASSKVDQIYIVGPREQLISCDFPVNVTIIEGGNTIVDTIQIGMRRVCHDSKVLVATADIPLLTTAAVDDFLAQCDHEKADLYYPIVSKEVNDRRYPGNKRTYVRLKEGVYTGGNIFLVNPAIVEKCLKAAARIIEHRKNPLKLCHILGWRFVLKFLLRQLELAEIEARVSVLLGIKGHVIQSYYPEVGIDVDKPSDLELVRTTFSLRA